jgi:hypothetical protein
MNIHTTDTATEECHRNAAATEQDKLSKQDTGTTVRFDGKKKITVL